MSDYLWDKTGGADPEVERLEELLGTLAHRPRPLELPPEVAARPRRGLQRARLAAAAALLLALLGGALFAYRQARPGVGPVAETGAPRESTSTPAPAPPREGSLTVPVAPERREQASVKEEKLPARAAGAAHSPKRSRRSLAAPKAGAAPRAETAAAPRAPGEAERLQAKAQLVYALRLTSVKLDEVRRRVRGGGD